jgi:hypothetical protein
MTDNDNENVDDTDEYDYIALINNKKEYNEFVKNKHDSKRNFDKVTHIHFGVDFNDPIYNIPETITHIKISKDYPHEIPDTVTHVCYRSTTGKHN